MSIKRFTIAGKDIDKLKIFTAPDKNGICKVRKDFFDCDLFAGNVWSAKDMIGMSMHAYADYVPLIYSIAEHCPEVELQLETYCDGNICYWDYGYIDGECRFWNEKLSDVYGEDDEEHDCEEFE